MSFELAAYGLTAGLFYKYSKKNTLSTYITLLLSMICGRIVWGIVSLVLYGLSGTAFTWQMFAAGAFINAIPGIILQIVIIPQLLLH